MGQINWKRVRNAVVFYDGLELVQNRIQQQHLIDVSFGLRLHHRLV